MFCSTFCQEDYFVALTMSRTTVCRVDRERRTIRQTFAVCDSAVNTRHATFAVNATNAFSFAVTRGQRGSFAVNATTGRSRFRQRDKRSSGQCGSFVVSRSTQTFARATRQTVVRVEIAGYPFARDCWLSSLIQRDSVLLKTNLTTSSLGRSGTQNCF